ncbi:MAG: hypothetical protein WC505_01455 [Patescibacteria group bacterium]
MNKKIFLFAAAIGVLAIALPEADCQAATIAGGNSMEAAVELQAGTYTGGAISEDMTQYFYVTLGQGQQMTAKVLFTSATDMGTISTVALYDQDRNQVVEEFDANYSTVTLTADWLVNGDEQSYTYYLMLASDGDGSASYDLTLTIADKHDAGSSKDAPATFDGAVSVDAGTTQGYVTGDGAGGNDTADMFVLVPAASGTYTITVTPPTDAQLELLVYDANRAEVDWQTGSNEGSILTSSVQASEGTNVFLKVGSYYYNGSTPAEYEMVIAAPSTANTNSGTGDTDPNLIATANANTNGGATAVNQNTNATTNAASNANTAVTANGNRNTNATADDDEDEDSLTLYLIIGGAAVVLVLIVVIIIVAKKKKTDTPAQQPPATK